MDNFNYRVPAAGGARTSGFAGAPQMPSANQAGRSQMARYTGPNARPMGGIRRPNPGSGANRLRELLTGPAPNDMAMQNASGQAAFNRPEFPGAGGQPVAPVAGGQPTVPADGGRAALAQLIAQRGLQRLQPPNPLMPPRAMPQYPVMPQYPAPAGNRPAAPMPQGFARPY